MPFGPLWGPWGPKGLMRVPGLMTAHERSKGVESCKRFMAVDGEKPEKGEDRTELVKPPLLLRLPPLLLPMLLLQIILKHI